MLLVGDDEFFFSWFTMDTIFSSASLCLCLVMGSCLSFSSSFFRFASTVVWGVFFLLFKFRWLRHGPLSFFFLVVEFALFGIYA